MSNSKIISNLQNEISLWESRVAEQEQEASELSVKIQDLKNALNIFQGEYNSRVKIAK